MLIGLTPPNQKCPNEAMARLLRKPVIPTASASAQCAGSPQIFQQCDVQQAGDGQQTARIGTGNPDSAAVRVAPIASASAISRLPNMIGAPPLRAPKLRCAVIPPAP